jgi:hypothetical protein
MTDHPTTPPPELVRQWTTEGRHQDYCTLPESIAARAARWGSDQELEACCKWLRSKDILELAIDAPRAARRPAPPSLKEQALKELKDWAGEKHGPGGEVFLCEGLSVAIIRRALEALPND